MHELFIKRCLDLAKRGIGYVSPNPMVGCVIVCDNKIIGEGWHKKFGEAHAEVNAINSVKNTSLLEKSTLYVNLEPCSHFGKTPPCTDLIIKKRIPNVVIGCLDVNPVVSGKGISKLRENGINVIINILEKECIELNKRFFTFYKKKRPYIILKWAETKDGFIDKERIIRNICEAKPTPITDIFSQQLSHKLRTEQDAILVGKNTVLKDNPELTARLYYGKNPIRILIDKNLEISSEYKILNPKSTTIVFNSKKDETNRNIIFKSINFNNSLELQILNYLYENNILSLIIEGGRYTLQSFIDRKLYDDIIIFKSEKIFHNGILSPKI